MDPRLPVIVGVGELMRRPAEHDGSLDDPAAMMAAALRRAADDAGPAAAVLDRAGVLAAAPSAAWPHPDPAQRVAELLGLRLRTMRSSLQGGNGPGLLVLELAGRIAAGHLDVGLVCGAEALASVVHAGRTGAPLAWPSASGPAGDVEIVDRERSPASEVELAAGMIAPIMAYPLIENAIRHAEGRSVADHLARIAGLWSRFSTVAPRRAAAWTPTPMGAEQISAVGPGNRLVSFPYPKLLNSNIQTDQAAALILCSVAAASALGVPRDRWVFVHGAAEATDHWYLTERPELHRSPAIAACGRALFDGAGIGADELGPVDLYSCFPAAVELAARELGLPIDDPARALTCTGGLTFFGGPGNNYATHGIAAVAGVLRGGPERTFGLATALGWYATKHALVLLGSSPPAAFRTHRPQAAVSAGPRVVVTPPTAGEVRALTATVIYERDGTPSYGILVGDRRTGERTVTQTRDAEVMAAMVGDGFLGSPVRL